MYDELAKRLRNCATQAAPCDACGLIGDISCSDNLMKQAADAIEGLSKQHETQRQNLIALINDRPRWIPVTERLPVGKRKVLVAYQNGVTIAQRDGYLVSPRETHTYWRGVNGPKHQLTTVTHWMSLPKPPKDGEA